VVLGEIPARLEDVYEPFLVQEGFIRRTARGREATRLAYEHLALALPARLRGRSCGARAPEPRSAEEHRMSGPGRDSRQDTRRPEAAPRSCHRELHGAHAPARHTLPDELIAQRLPAERREDSRLLVVGALPPASPTRDSRASASGCAQATCWS
jgi:hypothetical protein